jgi:hypothetical protein
MLTANDIVFLLELVGEKTVAKPTKDFPYRIAVSATKKQTANPHKPTTRAKKAAHACRARRATTSWLAWRVFVAASECARPTDRGREAQPRATLAMMVDGTPAEKVKAEMAAFRAALPGLLRELRGKWVVFREGRVQSVHDDEDSAFAAGMKSFGRDGGHVVAQVTEEQVIPLHAGVVFGVS